MGVRELPNSRQRLFSALVLSSLILACSSDVYDCHVITDQLTTESTKHPVTTDSSFVTTTLVPALPSGCDYFSYSTPLQYTLLPSEKRTLHCWCRTYQNNSATCPTWTINDLYFRFNQTKWQYYDNRTCRATVDIKPGIFRPFEWEVKCVIPGENRIVVYTVKSNQVGYGKKCNRDIDCEDMLLCNGRCGCPKSQVYVPGSPSSCYPGASPGFLCQYNAQCRTNDIRSYCSYKKICECNYPYKRKNFACVYDTGVTDPSNTNGFNPIVLLIIALGAGLACLVCHKKANERTPGRIVQSVSNGPMGPPPTVPVTTLPHDIPPSYIDIMNNNNNHNNSNNQTQPEHSPPPSYFTLQAGFYYPQPQVPYTTQNGGQQNTTVYPNNQGHTNRAFASENTS